MPPDLVIHSILIKENVTFAKVGFAHAILVEVLHFLQLSIYPYINVQIILSRFPKTFFRVETTARSSGT